jgi:hypothetical protein
VIRVILEAVNLSHKGTYGRENFRRALMTDGGGAAGYMESTGPIDFSACANSRAVLRSILLGQITQGGTYGRIADTRRR